MTKTFKWPVLLCVSVAWIALFKILGEQGVWLIPAALRKELTLEAYLTIVQLVTLAFGVGMSALIVRDVPGFLGLREREARDGLPHEQPPVAYYCVLGLLLAPLVYALAQAIAVQVALPTLVSEIRRGGRELAQSNTGQFGRELVTAPLLLTLFWGALVSPVCEEILFRGALFTALELMILAVLPKPEPKRADAEPHIDEFVTRGPLSGLLSKRRSFVAGTLTTLLVTSIFALLHADMQGGLGIVRTLSALGLAVACGAVRQISRNVLPAIALHIAFNALSIATTRHFFDSQSLGKWLWVPAPIWLVAFAGLALAALLVVLNLQRHRKASSRT